MYRTLSLAAAIVLFPTIANADVTRFMGGGRGDGSVGTNSFVQPWGVSVAPDGAVLIADFMGSGVRRLPPTTGATVQRIAGTYRAGETGDGGKATDATLTSPISAVASAAKDIYISEGGAGRIRVVDGATGNIRTIVSSSGLTSLFGPMQLALTDDNFLVVPDYKNHRVVKYQVPCGATCGAPVPVAGNGASGAGIDNVPGPNSPMKSPKGVAAKGTIIYIADPDDGKVRVVLSNGTIITAAGGLQAPTAVAVAPNSDIYVAEWAGNKISRIRSGTVTPVLGNCQVMTPSGQCQGQSVSAPVFSNNPLAQPITAPTGVAVSADGTKLYAASQSDQVVFVLDLGTNQVAPVATSTSTSTSLPIATSTLTPTFTVKAPPTMTATATRTSSPLPTCNVPCQ